MSLTVRDQIDSGRTLEMGLTVDEAVSFIIEALKDPLKPRWCGQSIVTSMIVIQFGHNSAESLTAKRTITDIETLASTWSKCECSYGAIAPHGGAVLVHH